MKLYYPGSLKAQQRSDRWCHFVDQAELKIRELLESENVLKSAIRAHEAGLAIVGRHEGMNVVEIRVFKHGREIKKSGFYRLGFCVGAGEVKTLASIRYLLGGPAGEAVLAPKYFRAKVEVARAQLRLAQLQFGNIEDFADNIEAFGDVAHPSEIWRRVWRETCDIIERNEDVGRELIRELKRSGRLRGKALKEILRRVPAPQQTGE